MTTSAQQSSTGSSSIRPSRNSRCFKPSLVATLVESDQVEYLGHRLLLRNASRIIRLDRRRHDHLASVAVLLLTCACETLPDAAESRLAVVGAQRLEPE